MNDVAVALPAQSRVCVTEPVAVIASYLHTPWIFPNGRKLYVIETTLGPSLASRPPMIRDANRPITLSEEIGVGSIVRLALADDGSLRAVQIIEAVWDDPFS